MCFQSVSMQMKGMHFKSVFMPRSLFSFINSQIIWGQGQLIVPLFTFEADLLLPSLNISHLGVELTVPASRLVYRHMSRSSVTSCIFSVQVQTRLVVRKMKREFSEEWQRVVNKFKPLCANQWKFPSHCIVCMIFSLLSKKMPHTWIEQMYCGLYHFGIVRLIFIMTKMSFRKSIKETDAG